MTNSLHFKNGGCVLCTDMNIFPSPPVPSSVLGLQPSLCSHSFGVIGHVGGTEFGSSDMPFKILKYPSVFEPAGGRRRVFWG
ncbi:hypothetical protein E2542_SST28383 [Spatholobus suberectus]|nr:hypothetical protein E2542_SST28383 [Spatholobus suberectus]